MNALFRNSEVLSPDSAGHHVPVLLGEVTAALMPCDAGHFVDATFGGGGYSRALLAAAACRVTAVDRDPRAVGLGQLMAAQSDGRFLLREGRFGDLEALIGASAGEGIDGIAFDLGVSSFQLDEAERGFSFRFDGPLDMRMGAQGRTAADVVNTLAEAELARILFELGEERLSRRIAKAIVTARAAAPIDRTLQLAEIVRKVVPRARDGIDPATRSFQALRLYVNDELGELVRGLAAAERLLKPGGRLAVVAFHSLEDRIVKEFLKARSAAASSPSRHLPAGPDPVGRTPSFRLIGRRPVLPGEVERADNPRARSARLRVAERTEAPAFPIPLPLPEAS
ncbi:MAG: 16S rRNA (cytosine(1402)-N(4))-methyltransferase RsmH [Azospirillum sp.]|nr:16S rRNA (cytosine(1402)-N(4))-methyltransferase RsmH [Azospirillum sp.]